jgi:hypothetical protein
MGHINYTEHRVASPENIEWLPVGRVVGEIANKWANRDDIVAYVGKGAGGGFAAAYNPIISEVEVDVEAAFGVGITPEQVGDLHERSKQYEFSKAYGAIIHEALHARYSRYSLAEAAKSLNADEHQALLLLEEGRIEALGIIETPRARPFLRSSAVEIIIADAEEKLSAGSALTVEGAVSLVALVQGRVDGGVLDDSETKPLCDLVTDFLSEDVVSRLRDIMARAQAHTLHAIPEPLYDLAREWVKVVSEVKEEKGEGSGEGSGEGGEGAGEGEGSDALAEALEAIRDALAEMRDVVSILNQDDLDAQERKEDWEEEAKGRAKDANERQQNREQAKQVFGRGTSEMGKNRTWSRLVQTRKPEANERVAAVTIANLLERAKYRDRSEVEITSEVPPGRLRTRAMVQGAALKSRGVHTKVEPWRRTVRKHTEDPTLTVGILVDISGSMSAAMEPMATTAWVMSEAARRVQGRAAMVYFGNDVFSTLKPGQHLTEVNVYTAEDGTEKFDAAFRALDGGLDLLNGSGARLLVVVSDGHFVGDEMTKASEWVRRCAAAGVAVLWLPFHHGRYAERIVGGNGRIIEGVLDPTAAAAEIGRAAADGLTKMGRA